MYGYPSHTDGCTTVEFFIFIGQVFCGFRSKAGAGRTGVRAGKTLIREIFDIAFKVCKIFVKFWFSLTVNLYLNSKN